jgi:AmmeMemoRadiSam system protein B
LGNTKINERLAQLVKKNTRLVEEDPSAHRYEHSLEVQLPFLQALRGGFTFVPIAVGTGQFDPLQALGDAMANAIAAASERPLIIASSDMNHYESDEITRLKDHKAIDQILALDARGLYDVIRHENISMCGFGPAVAMLTAAKRLGAHQAQVIKYGTSGDISGDRDLVVGYAGIAVSA